MLTRAKRELRYKNFLASKAHPDFVPEWLQLPVHGTWQGPLPALGILDEGTLRVVLHAEALGVSPEQQAELTAAFYNMGVVAPLPDGTPLLLGRDGPGPADADEAEKYPRLPTDWRAKLEVLPLPCDGDR